MTTLQAVKKAIQEKVPEKDFDWQGDYYASDFNLEDVLMAIPRSVKEKWRLDFSAHAIYLKGHQLWFIGKPLDAQSEEVINFLHKLLVDNK